MLTESNSTLVPNDNGILVAILTKKQAFKARVSSCIVKHAMYQVEVATVRGKITAFDALSQPNVAYCLEELKKSPHKAKEGRYKRFCKSCCKCS